MFNTIFRKLVAILLLFGLLMSLIFVMIMRYSHAVYHQDIQQRFHVGIATRFAELAGWTPSGWIDPNAVTAAFAHLVTANPQFHVYILDRDGLVLSHYPDQLSLASNRVSLQPIKQILQSKPHLPILGDDPANSHRQQIFSAAQLQGNTRPEQYLYVTIHNEEDDESAQGLRLAYITREAAWLIGASVILALAGGLLSLHFVVRPLEQLASTMDGFRKNNFRDGLTDRKKPAASGDEIDAISVAFYRMAEQIQTQMRETARADSSRREFIANASHDLRTPLASIQGYLDTLSLKNETLTQQERQQYLQIALTQAKSLSHLVSTLVYLGKLDSGQIEVQHEMFRIDEVVHDVVQKFALQAQKKNIRLVARAHDRLPFVCADLGLIERALSNLIDNALGHTPVGGSVQVCLQNIDKKVWVSVIDSGSGISASDLPHIFERFYRGSSAREEAVVHAGIGLSIVNRIIDLHGESVEATNAPGGGALFRFSLPSMDSGKTPCAREQFLA
ncbi:HAMP domain-containing sensor histidine kinase [Noviherbaspirillum sp. CPCC 100848]|uniref:histidine kinase n=1 Tax=Noviherbaspirillum album TaxID=3080276 RepID=A0ABU6J3P1_9BURK|nr:HAMP domain-containing sensor histidine kinase [Noviherbaspirillum sp. CPCC 100848]MEC4718068.1 HAMP domain-containing sensor histidine kinase [Noviherbaspirillum sp. CPCC 100848]